MNTATQKHLSVHNGKARFAQVTVALLNSEKERIQCPELFFGDWCVENPAPKEQAILDAATGAVRKEEAKHGVLLCVIKVECIEVDAHPEAAKLAALSAVAELIQFK